ncbi:MAG: hypothetical protein EP343_21075 [Deltaproteobacteria bacterium]|nr:MAG: hypothetical protein EP343_21075 [Deltaproteobacteria bacterium]
MRNSDGFQGLRLGRWWLSLCLTLGLLMSGCAQFVPVEPVEEENNPPYFDTNTIDPQTTEVTIPQTADPTGKVTFRISNIYDRDRRDTMYVNWFLGYRQFPQGSIRCQNIIPPLTTSVNQPTTSSVANEIVRKVDLTCIIDHSDPALQVGSAILLEMFIVDREPDTSQLLTASGTRTWPEKSKWIKYSWLLRVE